MLHTAIALHMFSACISSGMAILESAKRLELLLASIVWKWAKEFYVDFFGFLTSLEDVTDDRLDKELSTHTHTHTHTHMYQGYQPSRVSLDCSRDLTICQGF